MAYATTSEVKTFLGLAGTDQDAQIALLILAMEELLNSILGVVTLTSAEYTERIKGTGEAYLRFKNSPITAVSAIKRIDRTTDVTLSGWATRILEGRCVWFDIFFSDREDYLVTYTAGILATGEPPAFVIPPSIKLALAYMVGGAMSNEGKNQGVKSYNVFGKQVTFRDDADANKFTDIVAKYLRKYRKSGIL